MEEAGPQISLNVWASCLTAACLPAVTLLAAVVLLACNLLACFFQVDTALNLIISQLFACGGSCCKDRRGWSSRKSSLTCNGPIIFFQSPIVILQPPAMGLPSQIVPLSGAPLASST
eukprot:1161681-Pelagomonas_calceolata.AAC.18